MYYELDALPELDFHLENQGVLMAFQTAKAEKEEGEVMREAQKLGLDVELIDRKQVHLLRLEIDMNIEGAYLYRCDAHTSPGMFMEQLKTYLSNNNVELNKNTAVIELKTKGKKIVGLVTDQGDFSADEVVIASGAWTQKLMHTVGIKLPVQAGKGYSMNEESPTGISLPAILMESKVAVTPLCGFTRFSGTMEIAGVNHTIRKNRVNAIAKAAERFYPELNISQKAIENVQCGLRPLSPDRFTIYREASKVQQSKLSHWTRNDEIGGLGPATGKLIAELVSDRKASMSLTPFSPERSYG